MPVRPQKITLGEMRSSGVRGLLIYGADYHCSHLIAISADQWPDHVRLSDLELRVQGLRQARRRRPAEFHWKGKPGPSDGPSIVPRSACFDRSEWMPHDWRASG